MLWSTCLDVEADSVYSESVDFTLVRPLAEQSLDQDGPHDSDEPHRGDDEYDTREDENAMTDNKFMTTNGGVLIPFFL